MWTYLFNHFAHLGRPVRLFPVFLLGHLTLRDVGEYLLDLQDLGKVSLSAWSVSIRTAGEVCRLQLGVGMPSAMSSPGVDENAHA